MLNEISNHAVAISPDRSATKTPGLSFGEIAHERAEPGPLPACGGLEGFAVALVEPNR